MRVAQNEFDVVVLLALWVLPHVPVAEAAPKHRIHAGTQAVVVYRNSKEHDSVFCQCQLWSPIGLAVLHPALKHLAGGPENSPILLARIMGHCLVLIDTKPMSPNLLICGLASSV